MNPDFLYYKWMVLYKDGSFAKELYPDGTMYSIKEVETKNIYNLVICAPNETYMVDFEDMGVYFIDMDAKAKRLNPEGFNLSNNISLSEQRKSRLLINKDTKQNVTVERQFNISDEENNLSIIFYIYDRKIKIIQNNIELNPSLDLPGLDFKEAIKDTRLYVKYLQDYYLSKPGEKIDERQVMAYE